MKQLTLGQQVALEHLMVAAHLCGQHDLPDFEHALTTDKRDEFFGQIAARIDEHAEALVSTLRDRLSDNVRRGGEDETITLECQFSTLVMDVLNEWIPTVVEKRNRLTLVASQDDPE